MVNNEKGSALLMVLLTMTIFTIVGVSLITMNLNSSAQVQRTGNSIQATNLAEMGSEHLKKEAIRIIEQEKQASLQETKTALEANLPANIKFPAVVGLANPYYEIKNVNVTTEVVEHERIHIWRTTMEERVKVTFTSYGFSEDGKESIIDGEMTAFRLSELNKFPSLLDLVVSIVKAPFQILKGTYSYNDIAYFENGLEVESNSIITFYKDLYLRGAATINSNADLLVKGNAHLEVASVKTNDPKIGNLGLVCVEGTVYLYGDNPPDVVKDFPSCQEISNRTPPVNGIYAKAAVYIGSNQQKPEWKADNVTFNTQYK